MKPSWLVVGVSVGVLGAAATLLARAMTRVRVVGPSMEPALRDGDRVLVNRLAFRLRTPRPGDIVLARMVGVPGGLTIKRVAAVQADVRPGETLSRYVLLGDNARASTDSRHLGAVAHGAIKGRVWYRYWPGERRGMIERAAEPSSGEGHGSGTPSGRTGRSNSRPCAT